MVALASFYFPHAPTFFSSLKTVTIFDSAVVVLAAFAAIVGNNFSLYLKFRGGKGIGIATGIAFVIVPQITIILFFLWLIVFLLFRYVSLGSLVIALFFPVFMFIFHPNNPPYLVFSLLAAALVIVRHRSNIQRLITGTELRLGQEEKGS